MGWNAVVIFVNDGPKGYFCTFPECRQEKAKNLIQSLYEGVPLLPVEPRVTFEELNLPGGDISFGAYDQGCVLVDRHEAVGCTERRECLILERCLSLFPNSSILAFEVASVVSGFGYILYESGTLKRACCGNSWDGIVRNEGSLLEEEYEVLQKQSGKNSGFSDEDIFSCGESLAFNVAGRFLGVPFDEYASERLYLGRFKRIKKWYAFNFPRLQKGIGK